MTSSLIDSFQNMSLRKGETFHNPTTSEQKNDLWDPLEMNKKTPSMLGRSTTCPKSLEDLLIGAGERRAADLLARVDKAIETQSKLALGAALNDPEVLPVPSFMVEQTDAARPRPHRHSHSSDSGMGSSVADSDVDAKSSTTGEQRPRPCGDSQCWLTCSIDNAASPSPKSTHSLSTISDATERRGLSKYAAEQIHKYIIQPILREAALKDFHPLIEGVPERIGNKEIKNLRDLEKTLIFLAPVSGGCCLGVQCAFCSLCIRYSGPRSLSIEIPPILRTYDPRPAHDCHDTSRVRPARAYRPPVHARLLLRSGGAGVS